MKRLMAAALAAFTLGTASPSMAFEPESDKTIKLMVADWQMKTPDEQMASPPMTPSRLGVSVSISPSDDMPSADSTARRKPKRMMKRPVRGVTTTPSR